MNFPVICPAQVTGKFYGAELGQSTQATARTGAPSAWRKWKGRAAKVTARRQLAFARRKEETPLPALEAFRQVVEGAV